METQNQYHIHVDALELSPSFDNLLVTKLKFYKSNFDGHPEDSEGYEPTHHFTRKLTSGKEFQELFRDVARSASEPGALSGYIEGEYLPYDVDLDDHPFDPLTTPPIQTMSLGPLSPGHFRESEIHIVMDAHKSDPRLLRYLSEIGMFSAYMQKAYGRAIVFTAGGDKATIGGIGLSLKSYLSKAGGCVNGSIKEERIIGYWLSAPSLRLPPVITNVKWA